MDMEEINRRTIEQFRAGGEIEGMHRERLVLLTTVGRRSGEQRTKPMLGHRDGGHLYVIASNNGAPRHPAWYQNLAADPRVTVEIDDETYAATATPLAGDEYERLWTELKQAYPFLVEHESRAGRTIPVVELVPNRAG
jgi:deazaflavin-dependent oxidoreductase (nitroreductase family)